MLNCFYHHVTSSRVSGYSFSTHPTRQVGSLPTMPSTSILGIRIRSEGLAQVLTKRNASENIKGSIRVYRDTHARYCRGRAKLRWACPSSVVHSTKVGRLSWLSPRRSVSCIRVALHAVSTRQW